MNGLPIGVRICSQTKRFSAQITMNQKNVFLGRFDSPLEAHAAWQRKKVEAIRSTAEWYRNADGFDAAVSAALIRRADLIHDQVRAGIETREF
ncbi:hypothetical protein D3C76_1530700 [compost metagenome]